AVMVIAFLLFLFGACAFLLGGNMLRALAFPLGFLIFMAPIPTVAMPSIDAFLQHGSALAAQVLFSMAGTPFLRDGLVFQLPGINLQVAPECSGIQSSMVLLISGLLAGYLFLRRPWSRTLMVLLMIPLGLLRNGFRVFTIGELCVHIGPQMINSPVHHRGGPLFFALSLIPLFLLLVALRRLERGGQKFRVATGESSTPESKK
ncbi:MAG TPA: exosortase/archaeosortase family protein, partial [Verrucomicrobiae bacterium]|nr:exosortase/archaeosortase family protein [Verrucomicrobiae bacterium]